MAHYIAYATESGTSLPKKTKEQVISMLTLGLWGVPASAQLRSKLLPGDGLIVAVGSPHREFVGDAVLGSRIALSRRRRSPLCQRGSSSITG